MARAMEADQSRTAAETGSSGTPFGTGESGWLQSFGRAEAMASRSCSKSNRGPLPEAACSSNSRSCTSCVWLAMPERSAHRRTTYSARPRFGITSQWRARASWICDSAWLMRPSRACGVSEWKNIGWKKGERDLHE